MPSTAIKDVSLYSLADPQQLRCQLRLPQTALKHQDQDLLEASLLKKKTKKKPSSRSIFNQNFRCNHNFIRRLNTPNAYLICPDHKFHRLKRSTNIFTMPGYKHEYCALFQLDQLFNHVFLMAFVMLAIKVNVLFVVNKSF